MLKTPKCKCGSRVSLSFHDDQHWCPRCLWAEIERLRKEQKNLARILGCSDAEDEIITPSNIPNLVRDKLLKIHRLQEQVEAEYQRGLEEGSSCQAILEIQGRERFVKELKAELAAEEMMNAE